MSKPTTPRYNLITAVFVWCSFVVVSGLYMTLPMGGVLAEAFHATPDQAAWTNSMFSFAYALGFLLFGPLSDRVGRWLMMFRGLLVLAAILPLLRLSPSLPVLIALRAVQGLV